MKKKKPSLEHIWDVLAKGGVPRSEAAAYDMPDYDAEQLLTEAVAARYGEPTAKNLPSRINAMRSDMGLGDYNLSGLRVNVPSTPKGKEDTNATMAPELAGDYTLNSNKIRVARRDRNGVLSERDKLATTMHEVGHMQDTASSLYPLTNEGITGTHHKGLNRFEPEMALIMSAQNRIENGIPVSGEMLDRYPALKKVNPQSSNRLATPWDTKKNLIPADIWNAIPPEKSDK